MTRMIVKDSIFVKFLLITLPPHEDYEMIIANNLEKFH